MHFVYDLVVVANTPKTDPVTADIILVKGQLTRVQVRFLRGCHNQVSVIMRDGLTRIIPVADSTELIGDGHIFDIPMSYRLNEKAPQVTIEGWSAGTGYDHTITWFIDLQPANTDERSVIESLLFDPAFLGKS